MNLIDRIAAQIQHNNEEVLGVDTMTRSIEHNIYGPGKFEGESCIARFAYHIVGTGFATPGDCDCQDGNEGEYDGCSPGCASLVSRIHGPFTESDIVQWETDIDLRQDPYDNSDRMCQPCLATLIGLDHVDIEESESGFVYVSA